MQQQRSDHKRAKNAIEDFLLKHSMPLFQKALVLWPCRRRTYHISYVTVTEKVTLVEEDP